MQDGLYKVQFRTPAGSDAGVVVLHQGTLQGGDAVMYYFGTYTEAGNQASADVEIHRHSPGRAFLGRDDAQINLKGTVQGDTAQLTGTAPSGTLDVSLTRIR